MNTMKKRMVLSLCTALMCTSAALAAEVAKFVEFVQTDGNGNTGAWTLLDYTPSSNSVVEADVAFLNDGQTASLFCARGNSSSEKTFSLFRVGANGLRWDYNRDRALYEKAAANTRHVIRCSNTGLSLNGVASATVTAEPADYQPANKMMLFASYTCKTSAVPAATGNRLSAKLYGFRAWDDDGTRLAVDLYPCIDSDGVGGLYDSISGQIYYSKDSSKPLSVSLVEVAPPPLDDVLFIESAAGLFGSPSPAYGYVAGLSTGDTRTCTAPATVVPSPYSTATCTGWKLYAYNKVSGQWSETANGAGTTCAYTHGAGAAKLVWQWSVTDTPDPEKATLYVSPSGNDANNGLTAASAFRTIPAAIAAASSDTPTTIFALPGTYVAENTTAQADGTVYCVYLDKPVELVAIEGPSRTIVDATAASARAGAKLVHADAALVGFSFVNCYYSAKNKPTGIEGGMGVVSNCSVSARAQWAHAGWLISGWGTFKAYDIVMPAHNLSTSEGGYAVQLKDNASLDGFTACGTLIDGNGARPLLYLEGNAQARNVLIANCQFGKTDLASRYPFVQLNGAGTVLADSTIVNNYIRGNNGAVQISNNKATVENCIIWGNTSTSLTNPNIQGGANLARFFTSCSSEFASGNENDNIIINPQFVDAAGGDYHLRSLSPAKDMGVVSLRPAGAATTLECAADADVYVSASGAPLTATFSGYCAGEHGPLSAHWDFGDGTVSADWPTAIHTYSTPGAYTVTLTLNDGVSNPAVYTLARQLVCTPATCYMSTTGSNTYPYDTWEKATPSLQAALDVGSSSIVVTNGNYEIPAPVIGISRAVTLISVEGPEKTSFTSLGGTSRDHRNLTVSSSSDIVISGFTFLDGYAANYEWTASIDMSAGTLTNCVFKDIRRVSRSAACYFSGTAKVVDCVFDGHGMTWSNDSATQSGVRIEGSAVLDRCEIFAFKIENNNDATGYDGESPVRIASANAVLRNSYVHHCTNGVPDKPNIKNRGPVGMTNGRIENCTIVNNVCAGYGGGVWTIGGTVVNSIIWGNQAGMAGNDVYVRGTASPTFLYSCASDFEAGAAITGEGCTAKDPSFDEENPHHLTPLSSGCIDKGTMLGWMTDGVLDKDLLPRVVVNCVVTNSGVDMGCFEFQDSTEVSLNGTIDIVGAKSGRVPFAAAFEASIVGNEAGLRLVWDFGDGTQSIEGKTVTHTYETPGSYMVSVHAENGVGERADIAATAPAIVVPQVCYVSTEGRGVAPYMTWEDAATNIADAVELNPKTVFVADGLYKISNDINIHTDIELRSVNGPEVTVVDAQGLCRNLWMTDQAEGAVVDGFTFWRGAGNWDTKSHYARVEAGTLSHCIMSNCFNNGYRDSAVLVKGKGRMVDCVVDTYTMGGNADSTHYFGTVVQSGGIIERCTIQRYNYTNQGGKGNSHGAVHVEGSGIFRNCLVKDCVMTQSANANVYRSAVLVKDTGVVENCTIVNNESCQAGAGLTILSGTPTVRNCIIVGSTATDGSSNPDVRDLGSPTEPRVTYSCSPDLATGEGNITDDPLLGTRTNPFEPRKTSPCINAAEMLDWMTGDAIDLAGNPRVRNRLPDMGCYEGILPGGTVFMLK